MGYLQKNPPSEDFHWPFADLTAFRYEFSDFPEGVEVVDPASLIPSSALLSESEPSTPLVEGVSPLGSFPLMLKMLEAETRLVRLPVARLTLLVSELPLLTSSHGELPLLASCPCWQGEGTSCPNGEEHGRVASSGEYAGRVALVGEDAADHP